MNYLISNNIFRQKDIKNIANEYDVESINVSSFSVLRQKGNRIYSTSCFSAFVDGYLRDLNLPPEDVEKQTEKALNSVIGQWPLNDETTGSFSSTIIDQKQDEIVVSNDPIGVYPLYYLIDGGKFYISNSIIWLGIISKTGIDEVGLFQRTYCPEFANIGSRTILENCKRLLPGEWIKFDRRGKRLEVKYDNTLYKKVSFNEEDSISPKEYWRLFKKEIKYCTGKNNNVHIALSGGMDSRILMGAVPSNKTITCHTYGREIYYETKIAKRIAEIRHAQFRHYSRPELNFPSERILKKHTLNTEAVFLCSWLEILEAQKSRNRNLLLLGDMTESLQGRNLNVGKTFRTFWNYHIRQNKFNFVKNNAHDLNEWKNKLRGAYIRLVSEVHVHRINANLSEETLRKEIIKDLEDIFQRIDSHHLPILELNQELFSWFTHARNPMGKQILQMNSVFECFCPSMSIQILRLTSNIHPIRRMNGKFMKSLFSSIEELKPFGKIPTSQIPFIPYNYPDAFRVPIWFFRSRIDRYLIRSIMKSKKSDRRYRLLPSYNWVEVYQNPSLEKNLRSYFERNQLGEKYTQSIIQGALSRRNLDVWPLTNVNIINAAALNTELNMICTLRNIGAV